jgi:hypothetical protein
MFMHAAVQANLFRKVLWECAARNEAFRRKLDGEDLSIVVLGGGPGTELLGLAKHYLSREDGEEERVQAEVRIDIIDRVPAWSENVSWIKEAISTDYSKRFGKRRNWPALFDVNSFALNFSDLDAFGNITSLFRKDIFVLNYVVSEVFDLGELQPIMREMVSGCPVGAHFLFIDRSDGQTSDKVARLIQELGLKVVSGRSTAENMDTDEQRSELAEISSVLGKEPRITWNATWVLSKKPQPN